MSLRWTWCLPLLAASLSAQTTPRIGGAQTSNTRVGDSGTTTASSDASGTAHVTLKPPHAAPKAGAKAGAKATHETTQPINDTLPTDPMQAVEFNPTGFKPLVLHREPCVMDQTRDAIHTRGPVVIDVQLDRNGAIDGLDYIGAPDLGAACMEAVRGWKFAPYQFHGQPWRVSSWIRFEFATATQRSAIAKYP